MANKEEDKWLDLAMEYVEDGDPRSEDYCYGYHDAIIGYVLSTDEMQHYDMDAYTQGYADGVMRNDGNSTP
jgi:hypothetical protein